MEMFLEESHERFRPQVLRVSLGVSEQNPLELAAGRENGVSGHPSLEGVAALSGSALALCLFLGPARAGTPLPALVLSVGSAVKQGLPTASRATVAGISPLTGTYADSQVGGGLAARMLFLADALVLEGAVLGQKGAVLVLDRHGNARIECFSELAVLGLPERAARLQQLFPGASGLCIGPAGDAGVSFASLGTLAQPPSMTGRGGLGARLGGAGLVALVLDCPAFEPPASDFPWGAHLDQSPHLQARGLGGTFELREAFAARGDLPAGAGSGAGFGDTLEKRQSCPGCPTACRHVLKVEGRELVGRFSATHPLGEALGLCTAHEQLTLLATCNEVGVDAAEMGAALVLLGEQRDGVNEPPLLGDLNALTREVLGVARGPLSRGAREFAVGCGKLDRLRTVRGSAVRVVSDQAALLGQCVSVRGSDPMRVFPFLAENGGDRERLACLLAPVELPLQTFDSKHPAGKGRLVWWHENLANVVDASGFCAFAAAGLLGDGFGDLDDLARWLNVPGLEPNGLALQAAGASLTLLQRELAGILGEAAGADVPTWAEPELSQAGMWDEYRALRGLDPSGRPEPWALAALGTVELVRGAFGRVPQVEAVPGVDGAAQPPRAPGEVFLELSGILSSAFGASPSFNGLLPVSVGTLLRELAVQAPEAALWLWGERGSAVSVYRETQRLALHDWVRDGDQLQLVVAISGG